MKQTINFVANFMHKLDYIIMVRLFVFSFHQSVPLVYSLINDIYLFCCYCVSSFHIAHIWRVLFVFTSEFGTVIDTVCINYSFHSGLWQRKMCNTKLINFNCRKKHPKKINILSYLLPLKHHDLNEKRVILSKRSFFLWPLNIYLFHLHNRTLTFFSPLKSEKLYW